MSRFKKDKDGLVIALALFLMGLVPTALFAFSVVQAKTTHTETTTATIVEKETGGGGSNYTIYSFEVDGEQHRLKTSTTDGFHNVGDEVTINYNADDPRKPAAFVNWVTLGVALLFMGGAATMAVVSGLGNLPKPRRFR